jgi:transposase InsO family protein
MSAKNRLRASLFGGAHGENQGLLRLECAPGADVLEIGHVWPLTLGVKTLFIEPGSPWENGYIESFNRKLRDELLNREIFTTLIDVESFKSQY